MTVVQKFYGAVEVEQGSTNKSAVNKVQMDTAISAEATARETAISAVNSAISAETQARESAITTLSQNKEDKSNKKTELTDSDTDYPTVKAVKTAIGVEATARETAFNTLSIDKEDKNNKKTTLSNSETEYPNMKCLKNIADARLPEATSQGYYARNIYEEIIWTSGEAMTITKAPGFFDNKKIRVKYYLDNSAIGKYSRYFEFSPQRIPNSGSLVVFLPPFVEFEYNEISFYSAEHCLVFPKDSYGSQLIISTTIPGDSSSTLGGKRAWIYNDNAGVSSPSGNVYVKIEKISVLYTKGVDIA